MATFKFKLGLDPQTNKEIMFLFRGNKKFAPVELKFDPEGMKYVVDESNYPTSLTVLFENGESVLVPNPDFSVKSQEDFGSTDSAKIPDAPAAIDDSEEEEDVESEGNESEDLEVSKNLSQKELRGNTEAAAILHKTIALRKKLAQSKTTTQSSAKAEILSRRSANFRAIAEINKRRIGK